MRLLDADILAYALYDESPAHQTAWSHIENHIQQGNKIHVTPITLLETYNTLYWYYKVRPLKALIQKLSLVLDLLEPTNVDFNGLNIALAENIPLGDAFLIATAQAHKIPVIISNDQHIHKKATQYGLILENPITPEIRQQLSDAS